MESFNTDRVVPYAFRLYKLSKISGENYRDITEGDYEKRRKECTVFKGTNCNNFMLHHILEFKGEAKKVNNKLVKYNLYLLAHKESGFDSYVVLNKITQRRTIVSLI